MSLMSSPESATIGAMSWHMSYAPAVGSAFREWYARISTEQNSRYSVRPNPGPKNHANALPVPRKLGTEPQSPKLDPCFPLSVGLHSPSTTTKQLH
jgi:hypothetical protein